MAGTVYLKTDRFEVKLEGIAFKVKDFEPLCALDFLFPKGKVWSHPPVVGVDVLRHPRDPTIALLLLSFGIGCLILRFRLGEELPDPILNFLQDKRISFVAFGIPEKKSLFPFDKLGLNESKADVGYLAARLLNDPKLKKCELADLARRVLGIKTMVGLTEAESLGRHQEIKRAICEVFVSSVIAMALLDSKNEKKIASSAQKSLFPKNLDIPSLVWSKFASSNKENIDIQTKQAMGKEDSSGDESGKAAVCPTKKPVKGILKCSSSGSPSHISPPPSPPTPSGEKCSYLKRANSKGHNVSFKEKNTVFVS